MFSSCLWTLNCKPVDSEIITRSRASFNDASREAIVFYIFHPKKYRIVDIGRSISSVDWGNYAHRCSPDETVLKFNISTYVIIVYLAEANVSCLRFHTLKEIYIFTWVPVIAMHPKQRLTFLNQKWVVNPTHTITKADQTDRKYLEKKNLRQKKINCLYFKRLC